MESKLQWLRQMMEWQKEVSDPKEFMDSLKIDLFTSEVYVFTPKGEVIELPAGSIPLDFAYKVHTDIGNSMVSAKVNGKAEKLGYIVETGDTIEIKTQIGKKRVKEDWIKYAHSPKTQYKIQRSWKNI